MEVSVATAGPGARLDQVLEAAHFEVERRHSAHVNRIYPAALGRILGLKLRKASEAYFIERWKNFLLNPLQVAGANGALQAVIRYPALHPVLLAQVQRLADCGPKFSAPNVAQPLQFEHGHGAFVQAYV